MTGQPLPHLPTRHIPDHLLVPYALGTLHEAESVMVATHLALCPHCRARARMFEAIGGDLLDALPPTSLKRSSIGKVLDRAAKAPPSAPPEAQSQFRTAHQQEPPMPTDLLARMPRPLRDYLTTPLPACWEDHEDGFRLFTLPISDGEMHACLLRLKAGYTLPTHVHSGDEVLLILHGSCFDHTGRYHRGDVAYAPRNSTHAPTADADEDCYCLALFYGPIRRQTWLEKIWRKVI
jgi:putative transcriptional regulator